MYEEFFGLREKPFNLTPSPRFLYLSEGHKEALALLKYGVMDRKGFILLTGEVGTGKTTMVRTLLDSLNHTVKYVLLSNPLLSQKDFVNYLALTVFKKKIHFHSKAHFLLVFEPYLKRALNNHENFNLIIDEAHKLSFDLLEEIRLLSNMETGDDKLINIFLVGQPELNEKLSDPKCRSLLQRISIRHHIHPLNIEETKEYIATRLKVAGAKKGNQLFSKRAVEAIYDFSRGYPREINILADNALLLGYSRGKKKITPSMVKECYEDLRLHTPTRKASIRETENRGTRGRETEKRRIGELKAGDEQVATQQSSRVWKWAAVLIFFIALSAIASITHGDKIFGRLQAIFSSTYTATFQKVLEPPISNHKIDKEARNTSRTNAADLQKELSNEIEEKEKESLGEVEKSAAIIVEKKIETAEIQEVPIGKIEDEGKSESGIVALAQPKEAKTPIQEKKNEPSRIIIIGRGDTLSGLTRRIYGTTSDEIVSMVKKANPDIKNVNKIKPGQRIVLPQFKEARENATFTVHVASYKLYEPALSMYRDLLENGYEAYILPKDDPEKGKIFRVTVGYFKSQKDAKDYAAILVKQGTSTYANAIEVEVKR